MKLKTITLAIMASVLGCQVCLAQSISQTDLYNYIRTTWNVTSLSDDAIQQLLNQSPSDVNYDGIPYENLIGAMIESPRIVDDMNAGDYRAAGQVVLNYAQDQLFDSTMEYLGVASISFPVEAASWPLNAGLTAFANAVKQDAFNRQCLLYFAARNAGNTYDVIVSPSSEGGLLDADPTIVQQGFLTETDDGWLYTSQGAYAPQTVPGYTPAQFYQFAETLYQVWINRNSYTGDQSSLRQAFLADAFPQAPTIYQQPVGGSYAQGGSFLLSVGASGQQPFQYQWLLNGTAITGANNSSYSVQSPNSGNYSVNVTDKNSLTTSSESVTVNMLPTGSTVAISAPANNATLSGSTTVQVTAPTATSVAFYLDGLLQITDTSSPFSWNWNTATADAGQHTLTAKAYNNSTLIGTSSAIQVTLNNPNTYVDLDTNEPNNSSLTATPIQLTFPIWFLAHDQRGPFS
jgi:hypothetical protein